MTDNTFVVTINKDGKANTQYYSEDKYNSEVMPFLSANYKPEEYSVHQLTDTTPDNITEDGHYLVTVNSNGQTQQEQYTGKSLLGGNLATIQQRFPEFRLQSIQGAVRPDPNAGNRTVSSQQAADMSLQRVLNTVGGTADRFKANMDASLASFKPTGDLNLGKIVTDKDGKVSVEHGNMTAAAFINAMNDRQNEEMARKYVAETDEDGNIIYQTYEDDEGNTVTTKHPVFRERTEEELAAYDQEISDLMQTYGVNNMASLRRMLGSQEEYSKIQNRLYQLQHGADESDKEALDAIEAEMDLIRKASRVNGGNMSSEDRKRLAELEAKAAPLRNEKMRLNEQARNTDFAKFEDKRIRDIADKAASEYEQYKLYSGTTAPGEGQTASPTGKTHNTNPYEGHETPEQIAAGRLAYQTRNLMNKPNDKSNPFYSFLKAHGDVFTDEDFWDQGLKQISDNLNVAVLLRKIGDKIQKNYSNENLRNAMMHGDFDSILSDDEKELLKQFVNLSDAEAMRAYDINNMYKSGETSANSIGFMAQFILTGNTLEGMKDGLTAGFEKWLGKAVGRAAKRNAGKLATYAVKGGVRAAEALAVPFATALPMNLMQTGFYKDWAQKLTERNDDGSLVYDNPWKAAAPAFRDSFVEVYTEQMLDPILGLAGQMFKVAGREAVAKMGDAASARLKYFATRLDDIASFLHSNEALGLAKQAGWDGYFTEIGEEVVGAGIQAMWNPEAWQEFWQKDNLVSMAVAFAPMAVLGAGASTVNTTKRIRLYNEVAPKVKDMLLAQGISEDEVNAMFDRDVNTLQDVGDKISAIIQPLVDQIQDQESFDTIMKFAEATAQKDIADALVRRVQKDRRNAMAYQLYQQLGGQQFYGHDAEGNLTISTYEDEEGNLRYALIDAKPKDEEGNEKPEEAMVLTMDANGQDHRVRMASELKNLNTVSADDYFDRQWNESRAAEDAQTQAEQAADQRRTVAQTLNQRQDVMLYNPKTNLKEKYIFLGWNGEQAVVANAQTGDEETRTVQEMANALGVSPSILTHDQQEAMLVEKSIQADSVARSANEVAKGTPVSLGGADGVLMRIATVMSDEGVTTFQAHILKADNTIARVDIDEDEVKALTKDRLNAQRLAGSVNTRRAKDAERKADQAAASAAYQTEKQKYTNPDGSVREGEMLDADPRTFAMYSDGKYGKKDTDSTLRNALEAAKQRAQEALAALDSEANPDNKPALRDAYNKAITDLDLLDNLYKERTQDESVSGALTPEEALEKFEYYLSKGLTPEQVLELCGKAIEDVQKIIDSLPKPELTTDVDAYLADKAKYEQLVADQQKRIDYWRSIMDAPMTREEREDLNKANSRYQTRIMEIWREMQGTKDAATLARLNEEFNELGQKFLGQAIADINPDGASMTVVSEDNFEQKMQDAGIAPDSIRQVKEGLAEAKKNGGAGLNGYFDRTTGKIFLFQENNLDLNKARTVFTHENQHRVNQVDGVVPHFLHKLGIDRMSEDEARAFLTGELHKMIDTDFYDQKSIYALADEVIAHARENAFNGVLGGLGVNENITNFVNNIDNERNEARKYSAGLSAAGQHVSGDAALTGTDSGNELNQGAESIAVGDQGAGSLEGGEQAPVNPGITNEQTEQINRSVGGTIQVGEDEESVRFSSVAQAEGVGLQILKDDGEGNVAFVHPDGRIFNAHNLLTPEDIKSIPDSAFGFMMKHAAGINKQLDESKQWKIWNKYTLVLNAILTKGSAENGGYDYVSSQWQWVAESVYKTVAINSDAQYSFSLDITRVCKKNEAVINAIAETQRRLGYGITPGQIMDIYLSTIENDYQVPCPVCYVFSRYIRNGKYATIMINGQRKYGKYLVDPATLSEKEQAKQVKFWLNELEKVKAQNEANKDLITKANQDITELLDTIDKLSDKITSASSKLTAAQKEKAMQKLRALDAKYRAALNVVSQASLDSWITQFAIHKQKIDGKEQWVLWEDTAKNIAPERFEELALDLRQTATVMREYPAIQRFRNSRGAAAGKEIHFVANNDLGDMILALGSQSATKDLAKPMDMTDEEWEALQQEEYGELRGGRQNLYRQAALEKDKKKRTKLLNAARKRMLAAHIYAQQQSLRGGQRMWSWSDNIERLGPDVFINLMQLEMLGGALQSYSKQLEGIKHVASLGGYVNGSLMGKGNGYREISQDEIEEVDGKLYQKDADFVVAMEGKAPVILKTPVYHNEKDGKYYVLEFDKVVGIDPFGETDPKTGKHLKGLFDLNQEFDKAGNIIVGMNDLHVRMAMADDRIYFIIPWHSSGANSHILAQMYEYLSVEYDVKKSQDFTKVQEEKRFKSPEGSEVAEESDDTVEAPENEENGAEDAKGIPATVVEFWKDHYENARDYNGKKMAGKDYDCGIGVIESSDGKGNLSEGQVLYRRLRDVIFTGVHVKNGKDKSGKDKYKVVPISKLTWEDVQKGFKPGEEGPTPDWFDWIMADAFLSQAWQKINSTVDTGLMTAGDCKYIYPYEYWNMESTYQTADENACRYMEYCRRLGYKPKFCGKLDGKAEGDYGNFVDDKGYWKLLIDRRMYDVNGRFQDLTPINVEAFTPDLIDPVKTAQEFNVTRVADEAGTNRIVDQALDKERGREGGIASVDYGMSLEQAVGKYSTAVNNWSEFQKTLTAEDNAAFSVAVSPEVRDEMEKIKALARVNGTFMKAPNGQDTKLTEDQWAMVRTQNFKNWFGPWDTDPENASKVVDPETGEPMVMYHSGTFGQGDNFTPRGEMHFGTYQAAKDRARDTLTDYYFAIDTERKDDGLYYWSSAHFADMVDTEDEQELYDELVGSQPGYATQEDAWRAAAEAFKTLWPEYGEALEAVDKGDFNSNKIFIDDKKLVLTEVFLNIRHPQDIADQNSNDSWRHAFREMEADGYRYSNMWEDPGSTSYVVFDPNQVKSATANNGEFSSENDDIRFSVANTKESEAKLDDFAENVLKSGFNDLTLKQLDNLIEDIRNGKAVLERIPQAARRGLSEGSRSLQAASIICRGCPSTGTEKREIYDSDDLQGEGRIQTELVEAWARANNLWHEDAENYLSQNADLKDGSTEAVVYFDIPNRVVHKAISLKHYNVLRLALERVVIHNAIFPSTTLEVTGFGKNNSGEFVILADQPLVMGRKATESERGDFMHKLGFTNAGYDYGMNLNFENDELYIGDLNDDNVLVDEDGNIFVIDNDCRVNVPSLGGKGKFIPKETKWSRETEETSDNGFFSVANRSQSVFVSNALRAMDKIPMKKGNAQAWMNKLQQAGGLKKEEDKWLGLSQWLQEQKGDIAKEDVAQFIAEHQIRIKETYYADDADLSAMDAKYPGFSDAFEVDTDMDGEHELYINVRSEALKLYEQFGDGSYDVDDMDDEEIIGFGLDLMDEDLIGNPINDIRRDYTTDGLENKREIALTVPTIEPYRKLDDIHFGDAGQGRAVAWIRFGETVIPEGGRVLVIDEVQSKRHQDAKEKGYRTVDEQDLQLAKAEEDRAFQAVEDFSAKMAEKYNCDPADWTGYVDADSEDYVTYQQLYADYLNAGNRVEQVFDETRKGVPDAPFRENWHELAMKRMLRLAAEEGYDKIAWTNGEMQAERYNLSTVLDKIRIVDSEEGRGVWGYGKGNNSNITLGVNSEGKIIDGTQQFVGNQLSTVFGKEMAEKIMSAEDGAVFEGEDMEVGGDGMRFFYDQKLVNWMNKYGKQWGVKVEDITLPGLQNEEGWHSIDVTEDMKDSVMDGQVMFSAAGKDNMSIQAEVFAEGFFQRSEEDVKTVISRLNMNDIGRAIKACKDYQKEYLTYKIDYMNDRIEEAKNNPDRPVDPKFVAMHEERVRQNDRLNQAIELLEAEKKNPARKQIFKDLGVKAGEAFGFDKYKEIFDKYNRDKVNAELFDRISGIAKTLGLEFQIKNEMSYKTDGSFRFGGIDNKAVITIDPANFLPGREKQGTETMLHELLHSVTSTALSVMDHARERAEWAMKIWQAFDEDQKAALQDLDKIFQQVKSMPEFKGMYGMTNTHEMVAELANPKFRAQLKKTTIWERLFDAIKRVANAFIKKEGDVESNAYEAINYRLDVLLKNFPVSAFEHFAGQGRVDRAALNQAKKDYSREDVAFSVADKTTIASLGFLDTLGSQGYGNFMKSILNEMPDGSIKRDIRQGNFNGDIDLGNAVARRFAALAKKDKLDDAEQAVVETARRRFQILVGRNASANEVLWAMYNEVHMSDTDPEQIKENAAVKKKLGIREGSNLGPVAQMKRRGILDVMGQDFTEVVNSLLENGFTDEERQQLNAMSSGSFDNAVLSLLANFAQMPELSESEAALVEKVRKAIVDKLNIEDEKLSINELLWLAYDEVHREDEGIYRRIYNQKVKRNLGEARSVETDMTLADFIQAAGKAREDIMAQHDALMAVTEQLQDIAKAMGETREFDRLTVGKIVELSDALLESHLLDAMTNGEVKRLLSVVRKSHGVKDIQLAVYSMRNLILRNHVRNLEGQFDELLKKKATKLTAKNVVEQAALDIDGQTVIEALRDNLDEHSVNEAGNVVISQNLANRIADAVARANSENKDVAHQAELELMGLYFAKNHIEKVFIHKGEQIDLAKDLDKAKADHESGRINYTQYKQFVKECSESLAQSRMEYAEALSDILQQMQDLTAASHTLAQDFIKEQKKRVWDIHRDADRDLEGAVAKEVIAPDTKMEKLYNNYLKFPFLSLATLDQMLRAFGRRTANGEGFLFDRFMRGWIDCADREYAGYEAGKAMLDKKAQEIFGKKNMEWQDIYAIEARMPKGTVTFMNGEDMEPFEVTQGNMLYILLADQMTDGRMKLRKMGITEEHVEEIRKQMDHRFLRLAEWVVKDFLPSRREVYNEVHKRMFGANMNKVENYFPLRINPNGRVQAVDNAQPVNNNMTPSTVTGGIMVRTKNSLPLDIVNTDAFSLVVESLKQMEHWAAFAEWNRDISDLLSYKEFKNRLQNYGMTIYGSKRNLYDVFRKCCAVAGGSYVPAQSEADRIAMNWASGVTGAKINFRFWTALKQITSSPAFLPETNWLYIIEGMYKGWNWSRENLPLFRKRVKSRQAGDHILKATEDTASKVKEIMSKYGMSANAAVDAYTISVGAYAIYKTKYNQYKKMGFSDEAADKRAKQDATTLYNETQQSSEAAFMSPIQSDRSVATVATTIFRNSSFGYTRQEWDAMRNIARRCTRGYKQSAIEQATKKYISEGLEASVALKAAKHEYMVQNIKDLARVAVFGYLLPFTWNLTAALPYLIGGDDDDKKKRLLKDIALKSLFGPIEGLVLGNIMAESAAMLFFEKKGLNNYSPSLLPLFSDVKSLMKKWSRDEVSAMNDLVNLAVQCAIGVDPSTFSNMVVGVIDFCHGDLDTAKEAYILFLRLANAPQSSIEQLYIDELQMPAVEAKELTVLELADRYAKYKLSRGAGVLSFLYDDVHRKKVMSRYTEQFQDDVKERYKENHDSEKFVELSDEAKQMNKDISALKESIKLGDKQADSLLTELMLTPRYALLTRFQKAEKEYNNLINSAMNAPDHDSMVQYFKEAEEKMSDIIFDFEGGSTFTEDADNNYITMSKTVMPRLNKLVEARKDAYLNDPERKARIEELQKAYDQAVEGKPERDARIKEIEKRLKDPDLLRVIKKANGEDKKIELNKPVRNKLKAEKEELEAKNKAAKEAEDKLKVAKKADMSDYIPAEIYETDSFKAYMELLKDGKKSGNSFVGKSVDALEKELKDAGDGIERVTIMTKLNAAKDNYKHLSDRIDYRYLLEALE